MKQIYLIFFLVFILNDSLLADTLNCQTGLCQNGDSGDFCKADMNQLGDAKYSISEMILSDDKKNFVIVHSDGDQYTEVSFDAQKLYQLKIHEKIEGLYSDRYWWSDGDHTRYTLSLVCEKIN